MNKQETPCDKQISITSLGKQEDKFVVMLSCDSEECSIQIGSTDQEAALADARIIAILAQTMSLMDASTDYFGATRH